MSPNFRITLLVLLLAGIVLLGVGGCAAGKPVVPCKDIPPDAKAAALYNMQPYYSEYPRGSWCDTEGYVVGHRIPNIGE